MLRRNPNAKQRPREPRRPVVLPARLRAGVSWSDTCILNISSRGLMIHSARATPEGSDVELYRGEHVIVARVIWRDGARVGLRSVDCLPIDELVALGKSAAAGLTPPGARDERCRPLRRPAGEQARLRGQAVEFLGVGAIALSLALGAWGVIGKASGGPLARIAAVFS
jgi:hypothetical protein